MPKGLKKSPARLPVVRGDWLCLFVLTASRLVHEQNLIPKGILVGQECDAAFDVHDPTGSSLPKKQG